MHKVKAAEKLRSMLKHQERRREGALGCIHGSNGFTPAQYENIRNTAVDAALCAEALKIAIKELGGNQ